RRPRRRHGGKRERGERDGERTHHATLPAGDTPRNSQPERVGAAVPPPYASDVRDRQRGENRRTRLERVVRDRERERPVDDLPVAVFAAEDHGPAGLNRVTVADRIRTEDRRPGDIALAER